MYSQKVESLGVLAGGIAHDFNNLLMGITANATLILDDVPSGSASAELAQSVLIATEQAAHLTRQMLHYSGKGRFLVEPLSLTRQIENIVLLFRASIPRAWSWKLDLIRTLHDQRRRARSTTGHQPGPEWGRSNRLGWRGDDFSHPAGTYRTRQQNLAGNRAPGTYASSKWRPVAESTKPLRPGFSILFPPSSPAVALASRLF